VKKKVERCSLLSGKKEGTKEGVPCKNKGGETKKKNRSVFTPRVKGGTMQIASQGKIRSVRV